MNDFSTPAGWYPDGDGWERRWDGAGWTDERRRMTEPTQVRPATPPPTEPPPTVAPPTGPPPSAPPVAQHPVAQPPVAPPPGYGHVPSWGSGQPPQGYPGQGYPGQQGHPPASGPRKSRLGLWITLSLVLLLGVGTAVTLAVLQPWDGGDGKADDPKDPDGKVAAAVQGDVDGDGLGDVRYYVNFDYDDVKKVEAKSNGNGFELSEVAVDPYSEPKEIFLDWDGDGVNERLVWKFVASGNQITLSSPDGDFPGEQTFTMSLSTLREYGGPDIQVVSGDFDGDGDQDLAVAGPNDRVVDISVLLNDGKGTFAAPVLWLSIPNAVIDVVRLWPGDFDKDGDTDLWAQLPAERLDDEDYSGYYSGDRGYALLKSSGKKFEAGAVSKASDYFEALLVGDVTGDGTANLVGVKTNSSNEELTVSVFDVSSGRLQEVTGFTGTTKIGQRSLQGATLSDVEGDGKADLVFVVKAYKEAKFTGVQVMKSTGAVFEAALVWAETPACKDDGCRIEFIGVRRY